MLQKHHIKSGLFYITRVCPNHSFKLRCQSDHKPVMFRIHANRLKLYHNHVLRKYADQVQIMSQPTIDPDQEHEWLANEEESDIGTDDEAQPNCFVEKKSLPQQIIMEKNFIRLNS